MAITAVDAQDLILLEVGAALDGLEPIQAAQLDKVTSNIQLIWDSYTWKNYYPGLQALYTKRKCLDILLGQLRTKINVTLGPLSQQLGAIWDHVKQMRDDVSKEISDTEMAAARTRGYEIANLSNVPPTVPDSSNDKRYLELRRRPLWDEIDL